MVILSASWILMKIGISSLWRVLDPEISNEDPNINKNLLEMDNRKNMDILPASISLNDN